jgi:uncharacterized protein YprB with RNaseH-like and TPR domain
MPEDFDEAEAYNRRAGILAEFGKAVCISTGYFYTDTAERTCLRLKSICNDDEKVLLEEFIEIVNRFARSKPLFQFAGHNIREFDIPFLCRRMIINNLTLPPYLNFHGAKPWEIRMTDTLQWWKFGDHKHYTSLDLLANTLGVPTSKDDITGSMVQDIYYKEKDLPRIVKYCQKDVVVVGRLIQRFLNIPLVEDENIFVAA